MAVTLSIIIPMYNAENTIQRLLDSIYALSLSESNYEIIIIDDCSKDKSASIIKDNQQKHANIRLFCQPRNMRQGAARNRGIDLAEGEWMTFVDADDCVESGMITALKMAINNNYEICAFEYIITGVEGGQEEVHLFNDVTTCISGKEFLENYVDDTINSRGTPWGYIFNSSFIKRQSRRFVENRIFEDADVIFEWIINSKRFSVLREIGYNYCLTLGSSVLGDKTARTLADVIHLEARKLHLARKYMQEMPNFANRIQRIAFAEISANLSTWIFANRNIKYKDFILYLGEESIKEILYEPQLKFKYKFILKYPRLEPLFMYVYRCCVFMKRKL